MARKRPAPETARANEARANEARADTDDALWHAYIRAVEPLPGRRPRPKARAAPDPDGPELKNRQAESRHSKPPATPPSIPAARRIAPKPGPRELAAGETSGVDRRLGDRLRRGRLAIDATLDLHGHVYDSAAREVAAFIMRAHERGLRTLLIVTGKGSRTGGEGLLRQSLPRWLNDPELRARILAFSAAQPRHGGGGAFYVLLKKRRPRV